MNRVLYGSFLAVPPLSRHMKVSMGTVMFSVSRLMSICRCSHVPRVLFMLVVAILVLIKRLVFVGAGDSGYKSD